MLRAIPSWIGPDLARVSLSGHHCAKRTDVEEILAHPLRDLLVFFGLVLARLLERGLTFFLVGRYVQRLISPCVLEVEHRFFLNIDLVRWLLFMDQADVVADLAFEADVGDQPLPGLGIDARQVPRVRVAVGVAVGDVEEVDEVVTILDRFGHG